MNPPVNTDPSNPAYTMPLDRFDVPIPSSIRTTPGILL